jgi:hypothetical protein
MALERVVGPVIGPKRDDMRAGQIVSALVNVNRGPKAKALSVEDAMLRFELRGD